MGITWTRAIANCLYTGISTDTGCFRYTNTTAETLRIGADIYRRTTDSLKNCRVPAVFIHGTGDLTVSCEQGLENYNACASEKLWIPVEGAQHILACTVGGKDTEMKTERFLMQYIKPTPRKERKCT